MKPSLILISGWAHGLDAIKPMGDALADRFDVQLLTGAQVLRDLCIPDADYIVTGSMGGLLAMELLPASCKKLVLISSTAKFCAGKGYPCGTHEKILKRMILQLKRNPIPVLAEFYKNVHYPYRALRTAPCCSPSELVAGLEYLLASDVRKKVPTIGIPVLLLHGAEDRIIPPGAAEWLHQHLPDSRMKVFKNDGHALPAHHFAEMMEEISNFL
ncbi:alpha/beta fold hydrolase [Pontiella sulfatireligans]|uniref:Pimeloyl-[acyl-carrier protein] methyl ester esterase n=1 Tax=Pontiella sulfatireligans TaxID=2750658 RepID=A0A6C2US18_9BACT|nr:alpha/beta hydrolase [Pontiella sulfatireligans]VGO22054.1 Pimeloyl-[acyl-carrier protein] methyl ester esterase [Pontiella sulfatireligans]